MILPAATTDPLGIYTVKVTGTTDGVPSARTYLGIPLLPATRFKGAVAGVNGSAFSLQSLGNPSVLAEQGREFYVHVLDGQGKGFISDIVEFRSTDVLCSEALAPWMGPGTVVLIRPHVSISDLFGTGNRFGLAAGTETAQADNVVVWDPATQQEKVYYFHSVRSRWEEGGTAADASAAVIRFPRGCYIVRRSPGTLRMVLSGEAAADSVLLPVRPGANVFSLPLNLSSSVDQWIASTGDHAVTAGPNANSADLLVFEEPSTGNQKGPFYVVSSSGSQGWREVGASGSMQATTRLDFLSTLVLRRHGGPGYVLAHGSLEPGPVEPLPPDPEPGEPALPGELPFPLAMPPGLLLAVETSVDLQTWSTHDQVVYDGSGKVTFDLPAGQTRGFYRLNLSHDP